MPQASVLCITLQSELRGDIQFWNMSMHMKDKFKHRGGKCLFISSLLATNNPWGRKSFGKSNPHRLESKLEAENPAGVAALAVQFARVMFRSKI